MLRIRTGYSFRVATGKLVDVIERLKEIGAPAAPITDRASTFGFCRWAKLCEKNNIKPVFGVELAVTTNADIRERKAPIDHWTFFGMADVKHVNQLVDKATEQFYYEPRLTYAQAQGAQGVFKLMGKRSLLDEVTPAEDVFVPLGPSTALGYYQKAKDLGFQFAATSDNFFVTPDDLGFYEVVTGIKSSTQIYDQYIQNEKQWRESVVHLGCTEEELQSAMMNSWQILEGCNLTLAQAEMAHPERPAPLYDICVEGAKKLGVDLTDPVYEARLKRELDLIHEKNFEDYFYIVADICEYAKSIMLVGPARGSSCGSLVCYLLGITTIDPIPYGLIFERFIDINRADMPDIDIDFSRVHRDKVFTHLEKRYGARHVARLGAVAMYQAKSALKESGGALEVPAWKCEKVASDAVLIKRRDGDERSDRTLEDTLRQKPEGIELLSEFPELAISFGMEEHPRHYTQHAAGVVVSKDPITDCVAVDQRTGAAMCDLKDAETLNLLKIDALGLTQLSIFEDTLQLAKLPRDTLDSIPLDDPAAFQVLNDHKFSGIFQFEGAALRGVVEQTGVESLDDMIAILALARPGPLDSGGTQNWIDRKKGVKPVEYWHPLFEPILKETYGVITYQEQVMRIAREIGGLSWGDVTKLRKAMSKSLGKEAMNVFGEPWKKGATERGIDPEDAERIWDSLCTYGAYGFNKSHSVAYGIVAYQCCWLKAHYPSEFAAASLTHIDHANTQKQLAFLREVNAEGINYVPIDKDHSGLKWSVKRSGNERILVGPLTNIEGIGPKMAQGIISARVRNEPMQSRAEKLLANPKTPLDSLWPIRDAIARIMPDPTKRNITAPITAIPDIHDSESSFVFLGSPTKITPRDLNEPHYADRRGYEIEHGPTKILNLWVTDDEEQIFVRIDPKAFEKHGQDIINRGREGKSIYAFKGTCTLIDGEFRFFSCNMVRYIGDITDGR